MKILELKSFGEVSSYFTDLEKKKESTIAIDIECEMNLHCYGEHLCLIQIYDLINKVIVDPLKFEDKKELSAALKIIFESRKILKLTYDVAGDTALIEKLYGIKFKSVYDLRPAVLLLDYDKQNLSYILNAELGVPLISKKKFQTYNWMRRPIDPEALEYAVSDVVYLFELKKRLMNKIVANGLLDKYMLLNLMAQNKDYVEPDEEEYYRKRKGYSKLPKWARNRYKQFYSLREKYAEKLNRAPGNLINNADLLPLALKRVDVNNFFPRSVTYKINKNIRDEFVAAILKIYFEE